MIKKMIVKSDGYNLIAREKGKQPSGSAVRGKRNWKSVKFDEYFIEAKYNGVKDRDLLNYIQERFWEDAEDIIDDTIDDKECEALYENYQNRLHKRFVRYREKLLLNDFDYWVTFTYDDEKETAESFEKRLITVFNNFAKRHGWRVVGGWEQGELGGRSHFHAFIHIPEGEMVGELYTAKRYSYKRRRMEYYCENSYFFERFGMSDWIAITAADIAEGKLPRYLVKYTFKSGRRLFYSRGIKNEFVMEVDTENDIDMSYNNHGLKYVLKKVKNGMEGLQKLFTMSLDYTSCPVLDEEYCGYINDYYKVVTIYT